MTPLFIDWPNRPLESECWPIPPEKGALEKKANRLKIFK